MDNHVVSLTWLDFETSYNVAIDTWMNEIFRNGESIIEDNLIYTDLNTDTMYLLIDHINTIFNGAKIIDGVRIMDRRPIENIGVGEQLFELLCELLLELTRDFMWKVEELELNTYSLIFQKIAIDYNTLTIYIMCSIQGIYS